MVYNLDDLRVHRLRKNGRFEPVKIESSAYYQCLVCKKDRNKSLKIFSDYLSRLHKHRYRGISYEKFFLLYKDIKDNGFNYELEPKIILHGANHRHCRGGRKLVRDGQHRVSILRYLGIKEITLS